MSTRTNSSAGMNQGPIIAALLGAAWLALHVYGVFVLDIASNPWLAAAIIAVQTWLYVGLFIAAHDAIHGTLFGRGSAWNDRIGTVIHLLYAGFDYCEMKTAHIAHHDYPGTADDPDFNADDPYRFWPWYLKFFLRYFGIRQFAILSAFALVQWLLGAPLQNMIIMWAVPAILSSLQLFYFGTYLTHRHADAFADSHNARSNTYPQWLSLLTCFHFGYHHEHHLYPDEPWWRLPTRRAEALQAMEAVE